MKIAVATRYIHHVGGMETYLAAVLPALAARGHSVTVWHEFQPPPNAARIASANTPAVYIGCDTEVSFDELTATAPDVIFLQGLSDPALEVSLASIAPLVVLLHAYHGTCVSETKLHQSPSLHVCTRPLGPGCLVQYFPRRCGGWSPLSMVGSYKRQRRRQALLRECDQIATLSEHMRQECIAQGIDASRVIHLPAFTPPGNRASNDRREPLKRSRNAPLHLLFVGRMERLKGGQLLLDALGRLDTSVRHKLRVTFAGDGRERAKWERRAAVIARGNMDIRFTDWLAPADLSALFADADLLAVPSIWPEPLGLVGLEAAAAGVPAVAFDVGGIREWLWDGVTGRLAPTPPISSAALAAAIADCVSDPARLRSWGAAARTLSRQRTVAAHVTALEQLLHRTAGTRELAYASHL